MPRCPAPHPTQPGTFCIYARQQSRANRPGSRDLSAPAGAGRGAGRGGRVFHPSWGSKPVTASDVIVAMEELPDADIDTILGGERPLILAPHAVDESLGCGGLIAACCERGQPPVVVILTDGSASHPGSRQYPPERLRQLRAEEARQAVAKLGLPSENLVFFNYPDTALPTSRVVSE